MLRSLLTNRSENSKNRLHYRRDECLLIFLRSPRSLTQKNITADFHAAAIKKAHKAHDVKVVALSNAPIIKC